MSIISSPTIVSTTGGASLNIAYGDTAPSDTSKIWVKADKPESIKIRQGIYYADSTESLTLQGTFPDAVIESDYSSGFCRVGDEFWSYASGYNGGGVTFNVWNTKTNVASTRSFTGSGDGSKFRFGLVYHAPTNSIYTTYWSNGVWKLQLDLTTSKFLAPVQVGTSINYAGNKISILIGDTIYYKSSNSAKALCKYSVYATSSSSVSVTPSCTKEYTSLAVLGNKIYLFGDSSQGNNHDVYIYDVNTNIITTVSNVISADIWHPAILCPVFGTDIYILGTGNSGDGTIITKYDTVTNTSTQSIVSMPGVNKYVRALDFGEFSAIHYNTGMYYFQPTWNISSGDGELYLSIGNGKQKAYLISSDSMTMSVNSAKYFYGDSNNKATSAPVYYYNGTDWVQFT